MRIKKSHGFTLVEIAVVVVIVGLLLVPAMQMYNTYKVDEKNSTTRQNIDLMKTALSIFVIQNGRYPCPADRSLAPNDPNFGLENCDWSSAGTAPLGVGLCTGQNDGNGYCRVTSARIIPPATTPEPVLIGAVPIITLKLNAAGSGLGSVTYLNASDGWKNKLTYAVTDRQTNIATYRNLDGSINIVNEFNNDIAGNAAGNPSFYDYVILSHGEDGRGGFSTDGNLLSTCASGIYGQPDGPAPDADNPVGTAMRDVANCDLNGTFVSALDNTFAQGAAHYDDRIAFGTLATTNLWRYSPSAIVAAETTKNLRNLNTGLVGIGVDNPRYALDVGSSGLPGAMPGYIRAMDQLRTAQICPRNGTGDPDLTRCLDTTVLTRDNSTPPSLANQGGNRSVGIRCAAGQAMVGVSRGDEVCAPMILPSVGGWTPQTCPSAQPWLRGLKSDGTIICTN